MSSKRTISTSPFEFDGMGADVDDMEVFTSVGEAFKEDKPNIRRIGAEVCRFVRPVYIDKLTRQDRGLLIKDEYFDDENSLFINDQYIGKQYVPDDEYPIEFTDEESLRDFAGELQKEFQELSDFGVPISSSSVEVGKIPEYDYQGEVVGHMTGLKITSAYVHGRRLDEYSPNSEEDADDLILHMGSLYDAIRNYIESKRKHDQPFLGAIISPKSYIFGTFGDIDDTPDTWLVKADPIFFAASKKHFNSAIDAVDSTIYKIMEELEDEE